MKNFVIMSAAVALSLLGTGCATHKYVAKTVAPIKQEADEAQAKNAEQDKTISTQGTEIQELDRDLSRTKEQLKDTDNKATQAAEAARAADQKAAGAQSAADNAQQAANGAKTFAEQGLDRLGKTIDGMNKYQMAKSETVLFKVNSDKLTDEGKQQLDDLAKQAQGLDRFVIEIQGFTDKTGSPSYNDMLSERRAESVARYLTTQYKIPVRNITMLGEGYAMPVADDKTREGRKQNRRVEVKLWVPETESARNVPSGPGER
ncbi:MAG TPA: OmpA family protein [Bryobacteraceae bacterium]|jgi:OOP family OmpA-OmpF porin|nr:OmpA family protein [Bryobacteraceae bacterium]